MYPSKRTWLAALLAALCGCTADPAIDCTATQTLCGGTCVDVLSDAAHCGGCASECEPGYVCDGGSCKLRCAEGHTLCGAECVSLDTDRANCGSCGVSCEAGQVCSLG